MQPIAQFTVRPYAAPRCTWRVKVWSTLAGLRAGGGVRGAHGWCSTHPVGLLVDQHDRPLQRPKGELGVIGLAARHLSIDIVAHECTHAAFATIGMFKQTHDLWSESHEPEEQFAYTIGRMTREIYVKLAALGIYPTIASHRS